MSAELQAEYDAKMAEYYDYDNYEQNYASYGYDYYESDTPAEIVHPCDSGIHGCHTDANCVRDGESHKCECKTGFTGNGKKCKDVDECKKKLDNCHQKATCTNNEGSFTCACNDGFEG